MISLALVQALGQARALVRNRQVHAGREACVQDVMQLTGPPAQARAPDRIPGLRVGERRRRLMRLALRAVWNTTLALVLAACAAGVVKFDQDVEFEQELRLSLAIPSWQHMPVGSRAQFLEMARACLLVKVDEQDTGAIVQCLREGAAMLDHRDAPAFHWVASLEASLSQQAAAARPRTPPEPTALGDAPTAAEAAALALATF